ncbi:DsbA family protein [Streptomyces sp. PSKA54]|uniref:DsbA family protein n=1 Tax=Streptomyces himalayensis subsp. aureolus TaxID=2758039 RepID=A0A7W2D287_9ACTN|nr:DsbA family protein [Streptomyces himalayensis]MBA4863457.1 DsbA family protein [Streptomyces himalayensis subsp. aureolus]
MSTRGAETGEAGTDSAAQPLVHVTEFTDPACPWAWGSEPVFRLLRHGLAPHLRWRRVFGILFDEDDDPAPDPDAEARWYEGFIKGVAEHTHAPYAARLHWLSRTSWPASIAARAAEAQGERVAERVLRRLRETTFVLGTPADTPAGVEEAIRGVPGLDIRKLLDDRTMADARAAVRDDWAETRRPLAEVCDLQGPGPHPGRAKEVGDGRRYALPTLLFDGPGGRICVPGWRPLKSYLEAAAAAAGTPLPAPEAVSPEAALNHWRSVTRPELQLLTGALEPPHGATVVETANGPLWLHPEEAATHPATRRTS